MASTTRGNAPVSEGTRAEDYSSTYYNDEHLGGEGDYAWESDHWRGFFQQVADRLVGIANPATVLDVGCAKGLLVQALREKGVVATGLDISPHAVETAHPDVREHLSVASVTEPIEGRYSLVTCIEVLEHMSPGPAQQAIDRITDITDRVLFSSSPSDHREPTHINTKPTAEWAAAFAERGFFRRTDVDLTFLTSWAVLFERADLTVHELAHRYESQYVELNTELVEKRAALLDSYRELSEAQQGRPTSLEREEQVESWRSEVLEARHQLLTMRDHVVGTEAAVGQAAWDNKALRSEGQKLRRQLKVVRQRLKQARTNNRKLRQRIAQLDREARNPPARPSTMRRAARALTGRNR